jgi:hypothetical protein
MEVTDLIAAISLFMGLPSIVALWSLGRRYLSVIERREDVRRQELAIAERRIILEERERELEIYKLEMEIRRLEESHNDSMESEKSKQIRG